MENEKLFYKALMCVTEFGITIYFKTFKCMYETESMHFCIDANYTQWQETIIKAKPENVNFITYCKKKGVKIYRIHKHGSRIAFDTPEKAYDNLRMLKTRQLEHLKRDLKTVGTFLDETKDKSLSDLTNDDMFTDAYMQGKVLPNTRVMVHDLYVFG